MRYQSKRPKRQFLAGVVCPKCQKPEGVVQVRLFEPTFEEYIECIHCEHKERRPDKEAIAQQNGQAIDVMSTGTQGEVRFLK